MYRFDMELPAGIVWTTHMSGNGNEYRIGTLPDADAQAEDRAGKDATGGKFPKEDFGIDVKWSNGDMNWKATSSDVQTTAAITQYDLYWKKGDVWPYMLWFTNTENYNYLFFDETGDSYRCNCWRRGNHWVQYRSDKPTIIFITGS
ncbi:hypothetical protein MVEN_00136800 [Mycena venus]|uniref:Uncharacterized protein n=1 Tax=Mycena venus TaxID=2733690 RepID=A0A8H6YZQ9_9AGAR|nr:hypothetical protein MVEN_00136800 [Mycena venus]